MTKPARSSLPDGWRGADAHPDDVPALHDLLVRRDTAVRGASSAAVATARSDVAGPGAATRRHRVLRDDDGRLRAWGTVHDRAAARSVVSVVVDPDLPPAAADAAAHALLGWSAQVTGEVAAERGLTTTQLDTGAFAQDARQQRWLAEAGMERVRTWWQMSRPVDPREAAPGALPSPRTGVVVRRVDRDASDGLPVQRDLAAIHAVLEAAFTDHFNYHEETFEEFCSRLREDPGHSWDAWWIAELAEEQAGAAADPLPAGALIGSVTDGEPPGSYVEYLGVLRSARGRGIARSLLHAVFADAARRGRSGIGIEVDADSPTGAADLYLAMGFTTAYETQSWHRDLPVPR